MRTDGFVKIGISSNVERRIKQIQTGCPLHIYMVRYWSVSNRVLAKRIESELHNALSDRNTFGEWFKRVRENSNTVKDVMKNYNIDYSNFTEITLGENVSRYRNDMTNIKVNIEKAFRANNIDRMIKLGKAIEETREAVLYKSLCKTYREKLFNMKDSIKG